jgi:hypothetical protein
MRALEVWDGPHWSKMKVIMIQKVVDSFPTEEPAFSHKKLFAGLIRKDGMHRSGISHEFIQKDCSDACEYITARIFK